MLLSRNCGLKRDGKRHYELNLLVEHEFPSSLITERNLTCNALLMLLEGNSVNSHSPSAT